MTLDEAKRVGWIVGQADTCCTSCASALTTLCAAAFPEFEWTFKEDLYEPEEWVQVQLR